MLVLKGCGPKGYPGFPETGNMGLPAKLLKQRRRPTWCAFPTPACRAPRTAPWCCTRPRKRRTAARSPSYENGDEIELDVPARRLVLHVSDEELARRRAAWKPPEPHSERGYLKLYLDHVMQADTGADLDILTGGSGAEVPRESH